MNVLRWQTFIKDYYFRHIDHLIGGSVFELHQKDMKESQVYSCAGFADIPVGEASPFIIRRTTVKRYSSQLAGRHSVPTPVCKVSSNTHINTRKNTLKQLR